jgi:2-dehydropantoate 2-reductase
MESVNKRIAVVGAGAVGGYFGGMLARAGADVVLIGRRELVDVVNERGLFLDALHFQEHVRMWASTEMSACRGADVVLFCVKTRATATTVRELAPHFAPGAVVVSLQNGVENVDQIRAEAGVEAIAAAVYVAVSMPAPGHVKHVGRGDLVIGPVSRRAEAVADVFERAKIPCRISDEINGELWTKLLWNCTLNAVSALGHTRYREIAGNDDARQLVRTIVDEFMAVAHAAGVRLAGVADADAGFAGAMKIATDMADAYSSTAQDLQRRRLTEIDSFNGFIARRAAELGVTTPVNHALFTMVKLREGGLVFCGAS